MVDRDRVSFSQYQTRCNNKKHRKTMFDYNGLDEIINVNKCFAKQTSD